LYVVVCAAPPARTIHDFIRAAQDAGWDVCVVATPAATTFVDVAGLSALTNHPVRCEYRLPGQTDPLPEPDAIAVIPATFNTLNKWAAGIADTLAVGLLCEHLGRGTPILAVPYLKPELARHPAFDQNVQLLERCGVRIVAGPEPHRTAQLPSWEDVLQDLARLVP
jgi:phosphopantothenoylcysteine synthetase/decarboxylase